MRLRIAWHSLDDPAQHGLCIRESLLLAVGGAEQGQQIGVVRKVLQRRETDLRGAARVPCAQERHGAIERSLGMGQIVHQRREKAIVNQTIASALRRRPRGTVCAGTTRGQRFRAVCRGKRERCAAGREPTVTKIRSADAARWPEQPLHNPARRRACVGLSATLPSPLIAPPRTLARETATARMARLEAALATMPAPQRR